MNNINKVNYNYGIDCKNDVFITVTVTLCHNPAPPPLPLFPHKKIMIATHKKVVNALELKCT